MKLKIIVLIYFVPILLSCSRPHDPPPLPFGDYIYPLKVGNNWTYESTITINNQPDSVPIWFPEVIKGSAAIEITDEDSTREFYIDSLLLTTHIFTFNTTSIDSTNPQSIDSALFLFTNTKDGLYELGNSGGNSAVPVTRPPGQDELTTLVHNKIKYQQSELSAAADPKQSLKYPIRVNSEWIFIDDIGLFNIDKKIIRYEVLETKLGKFNCFVVQWMYDTIDIEIIDYYASIGLVRRSIEARNLVSCEIGGPDCDTVDMMYMYELADYVIVP